MLDQVRLFRIPATVISETREALWQAGRGGHELFVLWSGTVSGECFTVRTSHVPEQTSYRTVSGLLVRVGGEALHELNVWLYERQETLAAQVHGHPTEAFHSATDDTFPIVTALGGLSIVAANFARDGLLTREAAVFRLSDSGWMQVPLPNLRSLIEVF